MRYLAKSANPITWIVSARTVQKCPYRPCSFLAFRVLSLAPRMRQMHCPQHRCQYWRQIELENKFFRKLKKILENIFNSFSIIQSEIQLRNIELRNISRKNEMGKCFLIFCEKWNVSKFLNFGFNQRFFKNKSQLLA